MQMMREASLFQTDFKQGKEGFTLAAALLFAKETVILSLLPAYKVEAMFRIQNTDRYDDRRTFCKNQI
jgi:ATP-dependent DNA helicase RecG